MCRMRGRIRLRNDAAVRVAEKKHLLETEVPAQFLQVGDVVVDLIVARTGRSVRGSSAPRVEHDQSEPFPQARQVAEVRG